MNANETLMAVAIAVGAVVTGLVKLIKDNAYVPTKFIPLVALALGMIIGTVTGITLLNADPLISAMGGFLAGLSSMGYYSLAKSPTK